MLDAPVCDYQSERHCSKTAIGPVHDKDLCDYQSERHCSKTFPSVDFHFTCAITSQNGTAPKQDFASWYWQKSAITSQNGTAPKRLGAPRLSLDVRLPVRTALLQNYREVDVGVGVVRLPVRTALLQNTCRASCQRLIVRLPVRTALLQNHS